MTPSHNQDPTTANTELSKTLDAILPSIWNAGHKYGRLIRNIDGTPKQITDAKDYILAVAEAQLSEARKGYVPDCQACKGTGITGTTNAICIECNGWGLDFDNSERLYTQSELTQAVAEARQANAAQFEDILVERDARVERETRLDEARYWDEHVMVGARSVVVNDRAKARLAQLNPQRPTCQLEHCGNPGCPTHDPQKPIKQLTHDSTNLDQNGLGIRVANPGQKPITKEGE